MRNLYSAGVCVCKAGFDNTIDSTLLPFIACVAGVWKGKERVLDARETRGTRKEGGSERLNFKQGFLPSLLARSLAFLSHLKLPFPSLSNACHAGYAIYGHVDKKTEEQLCQQLLFSARISKKSNSHKGAYEKTFLSDARQPEVMPFSV